MYVAVGAVHHVSSVDELVARAFHTQFHLCVAEDSPPPAKKKTKRLGWFCWNELHISSDAIEYQIKVNIAFVFFRGAQGEPTKLSLRRPLRPLGVSKSHAQVSVLLRGILGGVV